MDYSIMPTYKDGCISFMMVQTNFFDAQTQRFLRAVGNYFPANFASWCAEDLEKMLNTTAHQLMPLEDLKA